jgi:ribosomal protein L12E/L44/L45/RPP1/RPP2
MEVPMESAESRALFLTAGGAPNEEAVESLLSRKANWDRFAELAEREGAFPVVWHELPVQARERIPRAIAERLRGRTMVAEFSLRRMETRLRSVLADLEGANIDAILLKGAAMVATTYGAFTRRPMGDVDLLVAEEDIDRAFAILLQGGWWSPPGASRDEFYRDHQHLPVLYDRDNSGISLELHRDLFRTGNPFHFGGDDIRRESLQALLGTRRVLVPSPAHLLLHACIHFGWCHLARMGAWRTFRDVHALLDARLFDWNTVVAVAQRARAGSAVYWTLRLAASLTNLDVPDEVLSELRPAVPRHVLDVVHRHFVIGVLSTSEQCPSTRIGRAMWSTGMRPGRSGHGAERPWSRDELYVQTPADTSAGQGAGRHSSRAWIRYVSALVALGADPAA